MDSPKGEKFGFHWTNLPDWLRSSPRHPWRPGCATVIPISLPGFAGISLSQPICSSVNSSYPLSLACASLDSGSSMLRCFSSPLNYIKTSGRHQTSQGVLMHLITCSLLSAQVLFSSVACCLLLRAAVPPGSRVSYPPPISGLFWDLFWSRPGLECSHRPHVRH